MKCISTHKSMENYDIKEHGLPPHTEWGVWSIDNEKNNLI